MEENRKNTLEEIFEYSMLYDFYGALLKEKNIKIFEDYVFNDMSLSEIAEEQGITRQGVRDVVVRCKEKLVEYENRIGLVKSFNEIKKRIADIQKETADMRGKLDNKQYSDAELYNYFDKIDNLSADIIEKL